MTPASDIPTPVGGWLGAAAIVASVVGLAGCHLLEISDEDTPDDHEAEVDPADFAEQIDSKLRQFSGCRDVVASVIGESWERYSDQVGDDGKPRRKREGVYLRGIGSNTFRSCRRVLEAAPTPPPLPHIEAETRKIVTAGSRYAELSRELEHYIEGESWRDDEWARLAELDPQLRAAHAAWEAADSALQKQIDLRHIENDSFLLSVLETRRTPLEVASRRVMIRARPMVRCMSAEPPPPAEDCKPLYDQFSAAADGFSMTYENTRATADRVFWMTTFANDVEEFEALAAEFQRKLGQRKPKPGDLQALTDGYYSLVRDSETLDFDFP